MFNEISVYSCSVFYLISFKYNNAFYELVQLIEKFVETFVLYFSKSTNRISCVGDELAQVVGCAWIMRDSGGSLTQNHWQGDLGLPAVRQDDTGIGRFVYAD